MYRLLFYLVICHLGSVDNMRASLAGFLPARYLPTVLSIRLIGLASWGIYQEKRRFISLITGNLGDFRKILSDL